MPDATEWLVEHNDAVDGLQYEHLASRDEAIAFLRMLVGQGETGSLYQLVPFEVKVDVTVHAPRRRRKTPPPAADPDSAPPPSTGPGNGAAGEPEGAAEHRGDTTQGEPSQEAVSPPVVAPAVATASPVFLWDCEARFDHDPVCPGPVEFDPVTRGRFCGLHAAVPEVFRREMHRLHKARNAPTAPVTRLAHAG